MTMFLCPHCKSPTGMLLRMGTGGLARCAACGNSAPIPMWVRIERAEEAPPSPTPPPQREYVYPKGGPLGLPSVEEPPLPPPVEELLPDADAAVAAETDPMDDLLASFVPESVTVASPNQHPTIDVKHVYRDAKARAEAEAEGQILSPVPKKVPKRTGKYTKRPGVQYGRPKTKGKKS